MRLVVCDWGGLEERAAAGVKSPAHGAPGSPWGRRDQIEWEVKNKGSQENKYKIAATSKVANWKETKEETNQMERIKKLAIMTSDCSPVCGEKYKR